jgi:GNAT superfamily N-acetyltransferase
MLPAGLDSPQMPLSEGLRLRHAEGSDLPRIAELREAVGWSVHEWALRIVLETRDARCLVVVEAGDRIVGVGSGIAYGAMGFVGNMIVDEARRRSGIGGAILESVLQFLEQRGAHRFELYATSDGRPLYRRYGFEPMGSSAMVSVPRLGASEAADASLSEAGPDALAELAAFDTPRFGGDRSAVLGWMLDDAARPLIVARHEGAVVGYGWIRPDGDRIGPLVADTPEVAVALIREAFGYLPAADSLSLNLPAGNRAGAARLAELGARTEPWGGRMGRGRPPSRRDDTVYANVVGALG